jgi:hypothetical protein
MLLNTSRGGVKKAFEYLMRLPLAKPILHRLNEAARGKFIAFFSLHRILDDSKDLANHPHRITKTALTCDEARKILSHIQKTLTFVSINNALEFLRGQGNFERSVAVLIIESPYAQTLKHMIPLAHELKIPLTLSICTNALLTGEPLWMDEVSFRVIGTPLEELVVNFIDRSFSLKSPQERVVASAHIIDNLSNCGVLTLRNRLKDLRALLQETALLPASERIATASQIIKLSAYNIRCIIAGNEHVPGFMQDSYETKREIMSAKSELEALLDNILDPVYIYPIGIQKNHEPDLIKILLSSGYKSAISRHIGVCRPGDNMFKLMRLPLALGAKSFEQFEVQGLADAIDEFLLITLAQDEGL